MAFCSVCFMTQASVKEIMSDHAGVSKCNCLLKTRDMVIDMQNNLIDGDAMFSIRHPATELTTTQSIYSILLSTIIRRFLISISSSAS